MVRASPETFPTSPPPHSKCERKTAVGLGLHQSLKMMMILGCRQGVGVSVRWGETLKKRIHV